MQPVIIISPDADDALAAVAQRHIDQQARDRLRVVLDHASVKLSFDVADLPDACECKHCPHAYIDFTGEGIAEKRALWCRDYDNHADLMLLRDGERATKLPVRGGCTIMEQV